MHTACECDQIRSGVRNILYHYTTHPISDAEVKSTVHKVLHHWEATTYNCIVKTCRTIFHLKCLLSKERQQVLDTLKGSTTGSKVKSSG